MTNMDAPQEIPLAPTPERAVHDDFAPDPIAHDLTRSGPLVSREVEVEVVEPVKAQRLASLDVFRGITIAAMLLVNNEGIGTTYEPLEHAPWHGWTPTDLIFPFFLFIVGVAIPFSFGKRRASETRGEMFLHVWARALALVVIGLLLHSWPFRDRDPLPAGFTLLSVLRFLTYVLVAGGLIGLLFPWRSKTIQLVLPVVVGLLLLVLGLAMHYAVHSAVAAGLPASINLGGGLFYPSRLRFPGVLQRIGVCYGVAATITLLAGWRTVLVSLVVLCAGYAALMLAAPYPYYHHVVGSLEKGDNFAGRVDEDVFDRFQKTPTGEYVHDAKGRRVAIAKHTYDEYADPEGLVSTLPAVGSVLCGILVGYGLASTRRTNMEKCAKLLANGVLVTIVGVLLSWWLMPINKKIWTPSFTIFTSGMGMLTLGAIFYLTDVKGRRAWAWPFKVYGMNAIAAFVLAGVLVRFGTIIKVTEAKIPLITFCKRQVANAVHQAGGQGSWWANHAAYLPHLDTPGNTSLAFSLAFVVVVLLLLMVMYVFKIFLKV